MEMRFKKVFKNALIHLNKMIFSIKKWSIRDTIIISGTPRAGTTWLAEIMSTTSGYTNVFEPLHPVRFPEAGKLGFQPRTFLRPGTSWSEGRQYIERALTGRVVINRYEGIDKLVSNLISNKLIVKFVRANRFLPWMVQEFPVRSSILIIRHPCAVIASQMQSGHYGYNEPYTGQDIFPGKERILKEIKQLGCFDENIINKFEYVKSKEEVLALIWCMDNYVPLSSLCVNSLILVPYEKLVGDGAESLQRIFDLCEIETPEKAIKRLHRPSKKASNDLKVKNVQQQLSKWKKYLSGQQIARILRIVNEFGLCFYTEDPEPDYRELKTFGKLV